MQLYNGDCLEIMQQLPDKSVDMVLCDLPYGVTACAWDKALPMGELWDQYRRVCVRTGREFIGIELDKGYFETAKERIGKEEKSRSE